jgi:ribonuclease HI
MEALARGQSLDQASVYAALEKRVLVRFLESLAKKAGEAATRGKGEPRLEWTEAPSPEGREKTPRKTGNKVSKKTPRKAAGLKLIAFTDGASRGNPGDAACAVIILDGKNEELLRRSKRLGKTTNNVAEYEGVLLALELAELLGARELDLRLDSELVVRQLNGSYKVKHPVLIPLFEKARKRMGSFDRVTVTHVPRKENTAADKLANAELDGRADDVI